MTCRLIAAAIAMWMLIATAHAADVSDLPLDEVAATKGNSQRLAIFISGDGGWAYLDKGVTAALAERGIPSVGLSSLRYFWKEQTSQQLATDVTRIARHYLPAWKKSRILLIGYSFGADVMPFAFNLLPADLRKRVDSVTLLGPDDNATFEAHIGDWLPGTSEPKGPSVKAELARMGTVRVLCLYGEGDKEAICPGIRAANLHTVKIGTGHHFSGLMQELAQAIVDSAEAEFAGSPALAALDQTEQAYADVNDAHGAIGLIDSGFSSSYAGKDRAAWQQLYTTKRKEASDALAQIASARLSAQDTRAAMLMRRSLQDTEASDSLAPVGKCRDAQKDLEYGPLREALYACFAELANNLEFEGNKVTRVGAFDLLTRMDEPQRRKALFHAFVPLWTAINGGSEPRSPYRRVIAMAAGQAKKNGSEIDAAAKTVGASTAEVERWLVEILDTWRQVSGDTRVEPWDYRYVGGAAERELASAIPRESMQPLNERYYADLGADLKKWGVLYDLDPRPGKAPLAYTDYVSRGRTIDGEWRPTVVRISGNYARGGLGLLNELVHENGHAVHMMAIHTRPAFMDLGDSLFVEAFADVPSWNTYEPAWQQKYLGKSAAGTASLRALYSSVMLDVAWALFELRMLRVPATDPNAVWTDITSRYLHIVPHRELSWWALRVQLVDLPGYMVNYGLGAVLTADMRQRIKEQHGPFETGKDDWNQWLSDHLLNSGQEQETATLLRNFLGRPVSPQALLEELRRMEKTKND